MPMHYGQHGPDAPEEGQPEQVQQEMPSGGDREREASLDAQVTQINGFVNEALFGGQTPDGETNPCLLYTSPSPRD